MRGFFLHLICGDSELSDDLSRDTFIKAYINLTSFRDLPSFSTWFYRIIYNVFYGHFHARKETDSLETRQIDTQCYTQQNDISQCVDIHRALSVLRDMRRTYATLFYMEDQNIEEIVGTTGCPVGTVKSYLSWVKDKMTVYLEQDGYDRKR